ncbi:hypothetical protein AXG93_3822s1330 [Marchantia polymorpha subsp. ruderalis]|uniref:Uncharacterized protein n=1 Tax=Marchantia polymorpha subsp. ruderalis TaxID=1480154 RepID=A0A176WMK9_MARPO|nr:hypothetical protein AXG93_3822s1330 [Marchantia polymorpha subsp. ruderalis]
MISLKVDRRITQTISSEPGAGLGAGPEAVAVEEGVRNAEQMRHGHERTPEDKEEQDDDDDDDDGKKAGSGRGRRRRTL